MSTPTAVASTPSDPPVPNRITRLAPPSPATAARDNIKIGILAVVAFVIAAICFWTQHSVPAYILGGLGLVFIFSMFTKKSDVGQCPYCMAEFRMTVAVKDKLLRCEQCGEYSEVANNTTKPLAPSTYSNTPKFESPVFKNGSMANACVACGAPATRLDTITTSSMNKTLAVAGVARLATGAPGVAIFASKQASITVPYCDQHHDAIALGFDWRKRAVLTWSSLRMMRRYLMLNRGGKALIAR